MWTSLSARTKCHSAISLANEIHTLLNNSRFDRPFYAIFQEKSIDHGYQLLQLQTFYPVMISRYVPSKVGGVR